MIFGILFRSGVVAGTKFVNCLIPGLADLSCSRRSRYTQGAEAILGHSMLGKRMSTRTDPLQVSYQ